MEVYLDHNATTPLMPEVFEAMQPFLKDSYGNPSSLHIKGRQAKNAIEQARLIIAETIGAESVDIIFTSGGTESDNLAIKGAAYANGDKGRHIITSVIEHMAVLQACRFLEGEGFEVTYIGVDRFGVVDIEQLKKAIRKDTSLISIMHANNEVGTIQPIDEVSRIAKRKGLYLHTDAIQSFAKLPFTVDGLGVDMLSLSSHKIYGPKGAGALYIRKGLKLSPIQHGGFHERGLRPGTENVSGIVGFGKAVSLLSACIKMHNERLKELADLFYTGLKERIDGLSLNGHPTQRLSTTLNLCFEAVDAESLVSHLDAEGIFASTGSACSEGLKEPSYVLLAMGLTPEQVRSSVRFSIGITNTKKEIEYCIDVIPKIVKKLRE